MKTFDSSIAHELRHHVKDQRTPKRSNKRLRSKTSATASGPGERNIAWEVTNGIFEKFYEELMHIEFEGNEGRHIHTFLDKYLKLSPPTVGNAAKEKKLSDRISSSVKSTSTTSSTTTSSENSKKPLFDFLQSKWGSGDETSRQFSRRVGSIEAINLKQERKHKMIDIMTTLRSSILGLEKCDENAAKFEYYHMYCKLYKGRVKDDEHSANMK